MNATDAFRDFLGRLPELASRGLAPEWAVDQQPRSRATRAKLMRAAALMLQERPLADIAVPDLARRAGVSVGALYARFPSKEAVVALLGVAVLEGVERTLASALGEQLPADAGLDRVVRTWVETTVTQLRRHRRLIVEIRRVGAVDPALARLVTRLNADMNGHARTRLLPLLIRAGHPRPADAAEYALFLGGAITREGVLAGALGAHPVAGEDSALVAETTRALVAYLRSETPAPLTVGRPV